MTECMYVDVIPVHLRCLGCGRMKFDKGDGTYFDYCGETCRNAHQLKPSRGSLSSGINILYYDAYVLVG